jgi:cytochrome c biogenesis protein CcdA
MTAHEETRALLALSAAGLLEPFEERRVREHIQGCVSCAAELDALAALSAGLSAQPLPVMPPDLAVRTQAMLAAELAARAEVRRGSVLVVAAGMFALLLTCFTWCGYEWFTGGAVAVLRPGWAGLAAWLAISAVSLCVAVPAAAALAHRRRLERSFI